MYHYRKQEVEMKKSLFSIVFLMSFMCALKVTVTEDHSQGGTGISYECDKDGEGRLTNCVLKGPTITSPENPGRMTFTLCTGDAECGAGKKCVGGHCL